ncbi:MAG: cytoskeleton protein RodZ [Solirubrobacteraceae bacterium]|jgi:transcriptional regulator with XRE-family HTH domain|nr:cytoskeleton protein RodZ [Solirubrobacteraceae bacterium]
MPDIGATLREARMRQRIDISEIESETKIRAKYLRALENEEWDLLPGPTYVKSFLRTYAEALGLDGKLLIEEYKLRHERLSDVEMQPIRPPGARDPRRRRRVGGGRGWAVLGVVALLLVGLYALGKINVGGGGGGDAASTTPPATTATTTTKKRSTSRSKRSGAAASSKRKKAQPKLVRLQLVPSGPVYVCMKRAGGGTVVNGLILQAGSRQPTYRSRRFRVRLGNSEVRLRVNGRTRTVPPTGGVLGYEVSPPGRLRPLPAASLPACGA